MQIIFNKIWQFFLPQHFLSAIGKRFADSKNQVLKNFLCRLAIKHYNINIKEALEQNIEKYATFNDFFDRYLLPNARPIDNNPQSMVSPADGKISECGSISDDGLLPQVKGMYYSVASLIGNDEMAKNFNSGHFFTVYLSPRDYHRVHSPITGDLTYSKYIPGQLFAVNNQSTLSIKNLMCRNERLVCHLQSKFGLVIIVFIGALLVNGIRTKWLDGKPANGVHKLSSQWLFSKGSELGMFRFGSTVIVLTPRNFINKIIATPSQTIKMGEQIAIIVK